MMMSQMACGVIRFWIHIVIVHVLTIFRLVMILFQVISLKTEHVSHNKPETPQMTEVDALTHSSHLGLW